MVFQRRPLPCNEARGLTPGGVDDIREPEMVLAVNAVRAEIAASFGLSWTCGECVCFARPVGEG